jgi:hypothetical protein
VFPQSSLVRQAQFSARMANRTPDQGRNRSAKKPGDRRDVHGFFSGPKWNWNANLNSPPGHPSQQSPSLSCYVSIMARLPRVVVVGVPHHVTQRGNARQAILDSDLDRTTYLELLRKYCDLHRLLLLGYCLMSNHVHLVAVPHSADALAQALKHAHGRYAAYWNAR